MLPTSSQVLEGPYLLNFEYDGCFISSQSASPSNPLGISNVSRLMTEVDRVFVVSFVPIFYI